MYFKRNIWGTNPHKYSKNPSQMKKHPIPTIFLRAKIHIQFQLIAKLFYKFQLPPNLNNKSLARFSVQKLMY